MFPASYPTSALSEKLKEIVLFPKSIGGVSRYFHRSSQISALTLRYIMDSGRYKEDFFEFIKDFGYAGYFMSGASDDGETRDGWDKFYLARDSAICIKKLDKAGITVPQEVRSSCEKMKLTFDYERGDPHGGCTGGYRTFLRTQELFKDVCRLDDPRYLPELLKEYNTQSLHFYLTNSDEEDIDFIKECVKYSADLSEACSKALTSIEKFIDGTDKYSVSLKNTAKRIDFISALAKTEK